MVSYCIIKSSCSFQGKKKTKKWNMISTMKTGNYCNSCMTWAWHGTGCLIFLFNQYCLTSSDFSIPSNHNIFSYKTTGYFVKYDDLKWSLTAAVLHVKTTEGMLRQHHNNKLCAELTSRPMMGGWLQLQSHFDSVNQESGNGIRLH